MRSEALLAMKECGSYSRFTVLGCTACSAGGKETDVRLLQTTEPMIQGAEGSQGGSRKKAVPEALEALTGLQSLGLKSAIALPERADKVVEKRRHVRLYLQMCVCVYVWMCAGEVKWHLSMSTCKTAMGAWV